MVDIVDSSVRVNELDEILDNLYDVVTCKNANIHISIQTELLVDTVATYLAKVISLI